MEFNEDTSFSASNSTFYGAIFMSNRTTKRECMKRKLFGLPLSQISFVKKIKSGMILFLFEYEERKLYGMYEATCDGALDIDPQAFTSSGKSFKAQIRFKIINYFPPLSEHAFSDAIKDNYYTDNKFHFCLSKEQVDKLIELFLARETNIRCSLNSETGKESRKPSRESANIKIRVTFRNDILEDGIDIENDTEPANLSSHPSPYMPNLDCSGYYEESFLNAHDSMCNVEPSCMTVHCSSELQMSGPMPLSHNEAGLKLHGSPHHDHSYHRGDLGFQLKHSPLSLGVDNPDGLRQHIAGCPNPFPREHLYLSRTDSDAAESFSSDYLSFGAPEYFKLSTIPKDQEPSCLGGTSLMSRYFEKSIDSTFIEGCEFHGRSEPCIPISINRSPGIKTIAQLSSPCNPGKDPFHSDEFCYSAAPSHEGSCENTQAWPYFTVPLSDNKKFGKIVSPFGFSSIPESSYQDGCEELTSHQPTLGEELTAMGSNFKSDYQNRKKSVFTRLTIDPEAIAEDDSHESFADLALNGLMNQDQMKRRWRYEMKNSVNACNPGSHSKSTADIDMKAADALDNEEELEYCSETGIPFFNFKRRSQAQKTGTEMITETSPEGVSSGKSKRRKLIRPSIDDPLSSSESKCLDVEGSSQEICESNITGLTKGNIYAELSESPNRIDEDIAGKDGSSLVLTIGQKSAEDMKTNELFSLENVNQLPVDAVISGGNRIGFPKNFSNANISPLIGEGQISDQSEGNTNRLSGVVSRVDETSPLSQSDRQEDIIFKECGGSIGFPSSNEGDEGKTFQTRRDALVTISCACSDSKNEDLRSHSRVMKDTCEGGHTIEGESENYIPLV